MYIVNYRPANAEIFYPDKSSSLPISVVEVGHALQAGGYDTGNMRNGVIVIHFLVSGSGVYNGMPIKGPCIFIMHPHDTERYKVDDDSSTFETYWIKIFGSDVSSFLESAGFPNENAIFPCNYMDEIIDVARDLVDSAHYENTDDNLFMLSGLIRILSIFSHHYNEAENIQYSTYTDRILNFIHLNYNVTISEKMLAEKVNLSTNYMHKIFLRDIKMTPLDYLNTYRVKCAKKMLVETDHSIAHIAEAVGFSTGDYFCRVFKKYNKGLSPTAYRRKRRQSDNK